MYYWNPKRIKELKAAGYKLHASPASLVKKSDQAISDEASTEATSVRPDPGHKPQASSSKPQAPRAASFERQASSPKLQGASFKPQASSSLITFPS